MAKKKNNTGNVTSTNVTNTFIKGMNKDLNASFVPKESWFHAINAYNNSADGDAGTLGNEPANLKCSDIPYPVIGAIHKEGDMWYIFSTDDISSEIGMLDDSKCEYTTIVNDACLNFNRKYLITGAAKENYDCTWQVYWDDNLNPSRTLNVDNIPYIQIQLTGPDINGEPCVTFEDTDQLDCEKIRLAPLVKIPCVKLSKNIDGGLLENGSYQAFIAYVVNEQKVTDYIGISNVQSLFNHVDLTSSLNITFTDLDTSFDFFELVILSNTKEQSVAKKIGIYSTQQTSIGLDLIDQATTSVSFEKLFARSPAYEKSESMYVVNDYLIRQGPTEQFDFNYQPLANQIQVKWQVAEYPADYYYKGGNKTSFLRDEQYAFFIRWIYNTGEKSASYHIPGRAPRVNTTIYQNGDLINVGNELQVISGTNVIDTGGEPIWQVYNTANLTQSFPAPGIPTDDGGFIIAEGDMAYWQSTERYPATKPEIYNASSNPIWDSISPQHDLCGEYIRHHKMPTEEVNEKLKLSTPDGDRIRILGVKFLNIKRPLFNDGTVIPNIVGYEVLRGSREGAKSILAKGIFKNMRKYDIPEETGDVQGLYPNYPYNDLRPDTFFHKGITSPITNPNFPPLPLLTGKRTEDLQVYPFSVGIIPLPGKSAPPLDEFSRDVFTFHTPDLPFRLPYLNAFETRMYGKYKGESTGYFTKSEEHPGEKLLRNVPIVFAAILGVGYALEQFKGKQNYTKLPIQLAHYAPYYKETSYTLAGGNFIGSGGYTLTATPGSALSQPSTFGTGDAIPTSAAAIFTTPYAAQTFINSLLDNFTDLGNVVSGGLFSENELRSQVLSNDSTQILSPGAVGGGIQHQSEGTNFKSLPSILRAIFSVPGFLIYTAEGANVLIDLFYNLMSYQDYALKHNSHGFYNKLESLNNDLFRTSNIGQNYIGSTFVNFGDSSNQLYKINNLNRPDTIVVGTNQAFLDPLLNEDTSRYSLGQLEYETVTGQYENVHSGILDKITQPICSLYGALKFKIDNQYGQLGGIKQTPMRGCIQYIDQNEPLYFPFESDSFFTGDVYVNRYTEKTIMPIFTDFLYKQPDGFTYDYLKYVNIPYPRYWMNTEKYDFSKLYTIFESIGTNLGNPNNSSPQDQTQYYQYLPSDLYALDVAISAGIGNDTAAVFLDILNNAKFGFFGVTKGYMYTHINGVQDFFVESEINIAQRDWLDEISKRHYDPYTFTSLNDIFDAAHIREGNFYLYDYSLSISRQITNLTNFSYIQPLDYDPQVAETCFTFYPKRLIYSLRAQEEAKKDFWRVFLPNNYKDFKNKVSVIKPINQTGAIMFFPYASPKMFMGVDQLQTDLGTKVILGDGGLFAREPKNITNSDLANEYASCESARSVINTPMGVFFISQAQGKIFQYTGKLQAISDQGMKWWFNKYLPSILLRQYPELEGTELEDNPVVGIGCQAVYDINDDIVYFMKKDYSVKDDFKDNVIFDINECQFRFTNDVSNFPIKLGDPFYFDNASWTVSYDPKIKGWISFHDWHPELSLPSVNHFLTTKTFTSDKPQCPPGYVLNNDTGLCEKLIIESAPGFVDIHEEETIAGNPCPDGYTFNAVTGLCELVEIEGVITSQTQYAVCPLSYPNQGIGPFGSSGTRFYTTALTFNPTFVTVDAQGNRLQDIIDSNNNVVPYVARPKPNPGTTANPWWNRLYLGGVWNCNDGDLNNLPLDEWIGFSTCVNVATEREYCLVIAGDNLVRIFIDGVLYADLGFDAGITYTRIHVFPIILTAGNHTITMEGLNLTPANPGFSNPAGFVGEIYELDMQTALTITTSTQLATYLVWSSRDEVGGSFITGENSGLSCPAGYELVWTANCEGLVCQRITTQPSDDSCGCSDGYTLVYPDVNSTPVIWNQTTGDCSTVLTTTTNTGSGTSNGNTNGQLCDCYNYISNGNNVPGSITTITVINCEGNTVVYTRDLITNNFPNVLECVREGEIEINTSGPGLSIFDYYTAEDQSCGTYTCCGCSEFTITDPNASGNQGIPGFTVTFERCNDGQEVTRQFIGSEALFIECARNNSLQFPPNINFNQLNIVENPCGTYPCDDTTGGGTIVTTETYDAICRKIDCGCPPSPIPNATVTQTGDCDNLNVYTTTGIDVIPPGLIQCDYQALLQVPPSFERGSIWRHNYRCDLFANYYGVDYPWEVELVENTGQMVTTVRSLEYQLETYVYKGDLINGCGDDRWHDLDFNFDKSIIYNSEQVSGLLTLIPHPKEDPLSMITYPIIGGSDIQILYSKEEQKYRFNQFWDITRDRDEFTTYPAPTYQYQPGVTPLDSPGQNIFITQLNGYIKDLNLNNLAYSKTSGQRKKFRHYYNKVILRRTLSGNRKMLLKLNNTKLNLSVR